MPKLPTQPENARAIPLRSGFYALPFNQGKNFLFTRLHQQNQEEEEDEAVETGEEEGQHKVFVTGIPLGMSEKGLKQTLNKVWESDKIKSIQLLPTSNQMNNGPHGPLSLLTKELTAAQHAIPIQGITISPLFSPNSTPSTPSSSSSAIVSFSSPPTLPPPSYPSSTSLTIASQPSYLSISSQLHSLSRPHRSLVIAHVDTWMQSYDSRKLASAPSSYSADVLIAEREQQAAAQSALSKKKKRGKKATVDVGPLPGSAAAALARHAEEQKKRFDKSHNPDEVQDGEWTLVTGGGKHGKSLLPTGVEPTVEGYGGVTVKVARKKRGKTTTTEGEGEEGGNDQGIRKIVGDGFYRFNQADSRRKSLAALKTRFEEDKARVDRMREGGRGGRGGGGGGFRGGRGGFSSRGGTSSRGGSSSRGGGSRGRGGGRGGGSGAGREGRSYKPY
ncbi:uncharacterized protein JCM6883_003057 [Sporobolomyces salmoneus]|uniref:uncharacterized protein n=1 Tax=Sporobolomyces salmoneus TaxID=183962 RepID=UPI003175021E